MSWKTNRRTRTPYPAIFGSPGTMTGYELCGRAGCGHASSMHGPRGCELDPVGHCGAFVMESLPKSSTHEFFNAPLGIQSVPLPTRHCAGCGKNFIFTVEENARHKRHGEVSRI